MPSWRTQASRWWYIFRYHRLGQLVRRALGRPRRWSLRLTGGRRYTRPAGPLPALRSNPAFRPVLQHKLAARRESGAAQPAAEVRDGRLTFLNRTLTLPDPIDWRLSGWPDVPHLWRFHLHYHEFLLDLAGEGLSSGDRYWCEHAWQLAGHWIETNPLSDPRVLDDAWHPFCISRRLPVWTLLWSASPPPSESTEAILRSAVAQARFLADHLETDLGGNHLLENARALVFAGAFYDGPAADGWLTLGSKLLHREVPKQVLPCGEHFERSPMYHAQILEALLDIRDVTATIAPDLSSLCAGTARRMATFLSEILHPDGEIPLLGDSCFGESPCPETLIARAGVREEEPTPTSGPAAGSPARRTGDYWVLRDGGDFLLFDAGPAGADHLPAHAHADLLTIEASIGGHRLIVDSGVFNYEADEMRQYCRSTAAHNVLQIDDQDQCDMWSRFRMGYRGHPRGFRSGEDAGFYWAQAEHNAYRRLGVPVVGRWIACRRGGPWLCLDRALGHGEHQLTSRLHLSPEASIQQTGPLEVRIELHGHVATLVHLVPGQLEITSGWYCPHFGNRLPAPVIQWSATRPLPTITGWCLLRPTNRGRATLETPDALRPVLRWHDGPTPVGLRPFAPPPA